MSESKAREEITWVARAITYLIYAYVMIVQIILVVGFILKLFGANPSAGFVEWWYRGLERVMAPFRGIFTPVELGTTGNDVQAVLDTSILFAMVVYAIVLLLLRAGIDWLTHRLEMQRHERELEVRRRELAEAEQRRAEAAARAMQAQQAQQAAGATAPGVPGAPTDPTAPVAPGAPTPPPQPGASGAGTPPPPPAT